jgi:hypothetical protein
MLGSLWGVMFHSNIAGHALCLASTIGARRGLEVFPKFPPSFLENRLFLYSG